jgi:hypothetical protein
MIYSRYRLTLLAALLSARALVAQSGTGAVLGSGTTSVTGLVVDSLAHKPLFGAVVELVNADSLALAPRSATTDSLGRFAFGGVKSGRYLMAFLHPMTDSLGIEPKAREVFVDGRTPVRADLGIPSANTIRRTICGERAVADSDALILGFIRRAADRMSVDSARVSAQWIEILLQTGGFKRDIARRQFITPETGWFAICGAPSAGTIMLSAAHPGDSTVSLELEVPADGFLRRDLYFGVSRVAPGEPAQVVPDSTALTRGPRLVGDGRLTGVVTAVSGGRPLSGARVNITNGAQVRANERGEWTLSAIPTGTRMLEVRAVGFYPVTIPVDVYDGAGPVQIAMSTVKAVLDTVKVIATRTGNRNLLEFNQRKRSSGTGRFLTGEEIQARNPTATSDLFRTIPGVSVDRDRNGDEILTMRGNLSGRCQANVYLNRTSLRGLSANDINGFVRPNELLGVEVYSATGAPPGFSEQNGCGSIIIWTR